MSITTNKKTLTMNQERQEKINQVASKLGLPSNTGFTELFEAIANYITGENLPVAKIEFSDEKQEYFQSSKEDVKQAVREKLGIQDEKIVINRSQIVELAKDVAKIHDEQTIIDSGVDLFCQTQIARYINTTGETIGKTGLAGNADQRIIDQIKMNLQFFESGMCDTIVGTRIYNGAGTGMSTFKTFLKRYGLTEWFYLDGKSIKIDETNFQDFKRAVLPIIGE